MDPLEEMITIRGSKKHIQAGLGAGWDLVADTGTPLYAPFDGRVETYSGHQGGYWLRLIRPNGDVIEFAHLSRYVVTRGEVQEGQLIAYTGNTGAKTTGPHLHIQIKRNGRRLYPEKYNWGTGSWKTKVNAVIREIAGREPMVKEQKYFAKRIHQGTIINYKDLRIKVRFWMKVIPRFIFLIEIQRNGIWDKN